jgi:NhaP-type Na+/H+ or K+/H+ antiporter
MGKWGVAGWKGLVPVSTKTSIPGFGRSMNHLASCIYLLSEVIWIASVTICFTAMLKLSGDF